MRLFSLNENEMNKYMEGMEGKPFEITYPTHGIYLKALSYYKSVDRLIEDLGYVNEMTGYKLVIKW